MTDSRGPEREAHLVRRAREGDAEALAELMRFWQPALEQIARSLHRRYGRLGFDTHDLVATSIRRLLRRRGGAGAEERDLAFLHHILRDAYSEKARAELRRRRHESAAARERRWSHGDPSPPTPLLPSERHADGRWLKGVTPDDWELVLLWKQGLSWSQIGEHLDVPPETARKRWHRMLRRLREQRREAEATGGEASVSGSPAPPSESGSPDQAADPGPPPDRAA